MSESNVQQLSFTINGRIMTDVAREHFYVRNDLVKALDVLMAGLMTGQLDEYQRMALALRVLDGKAELAGDYPGPDYGYYDLDEPDERFSLRDHFNKMAEELEKTKAELREVQEKFLCCADNMSDSAKHAANTSWFYGDRSRKQPIFEMERAAPTLGEILDRFGWNRAKQEQVKESEYKYGDFGWLEPNGEYHPVQFADHEQFAHKTVKERGWWDEYDRSDCNGTYAFGDFLVNKKGWVLLHNPYGGPPHASTSQIRQLTKAQKEFLFDYFTERERNDEAKQYLED